MSAPPPRRPAARRRAVVVPAALAALLLAGCGEHAVLGPDGPAARSIARLGWFMLIAAFVIGGGYLLGLGYALWRGGRRPATPPGEEAGELGASGTSGASGGWSWPAVSCCRCWSSPR
ncbi:MAG: hypothetical protein R2755_22480 [Acidimicrobiales bacterium]